MANFSALLTILRRDVLGEGTNTGAGGFQNTDLLNMLYRSAREVSRYIDAAEKIDNTATMVSAATAFTAPSDVAEISNVFIKNRLLEKRPYSYILSKRLTSTSKPTYWAWDVRRNNGTQVAIAPAFSGTASAGDVIVEYFPHYETASYTQGDTPWDGELLPWHWIISYRAGVYAWQSVGRADKAQEAAGGFNDGIQNLAARIGDTNLLNLLIEPAQRADRGVAHEP